MTFPYGGTETTPALLLTISVSGPWERTALEIAAKIDTGASISGFPARYRERAGLRYARDIRARGAFDAEKTLRSLYFVRVKLPLAGAAWKTMPVLLVEDDCFLLGRDILNQHLLQANGPKLFFDLTKPSEPA